MKIIKYLVVIFCFSIFNLYSQNITIAPAPLKSDLDLPASVRTQVATKLMRAMTKNGYGADYGMSTVIIEPQISINDQQTKASIPPQVEVDFDLVFSIKETINNNVSFASYTVPFKNKANNAKSAVSKALAKLDLNESEFDNFLQSAKNKILEFYEANINLYINKANMYMNTNKYEDAILILVGIPEYIGVYEKVLPILEKAYIGYSKKVSDQLLQEAKVVWAASPNKAGAMKVAQILSNLPAGATKSKELTSLLKTINSKVKLDQDKEWKMLESKMKNQHMEKKAMIEAARAVGVAHAKQNSSVYIVR